MTEVKHNVAYVKDNYKLEDQISKDLGSPEKDSDRKALYYCPFHSENSPSFVVSKDKQTYQCYGCGKRGSIIDYVIERGFVRDFSDAIHYIMGTIKIASVPHSIAKHTYTPSKPRPAPTLEDVQAYHANREAALPYFESRGIHEQAVDQFLLGAQTTYTRKYWFKNDQFAIEAGHECIEFTHKRYTYPWMSGIAVRMVNKRRDDSEAMNCLRSIDTELNYLIRADIAWKHNNNPKNAKWEPKDVTDKRLMDECFGHKFDQVGQGTIFNLNQLFEKDDQGQLVIVSGKPKPIRQDYCVIVEGEADAIAAEQCGFTAVATKVQGRIDFVHAFSGVFQPIICIDSDSAGEIYGNAMFHTLGRGRIVPMKSGFKDVNDMVKARLFTDWMYRKVGLKPTINIVF